MNGSRTGADLLDPGGLSPAAANMLRDLDIFLHETAMPDAELCKRAEVKPDVLRNLRAGISISSMTTDRLRSWLTANGARTTVITMEGRLMRTTSVLPGNPDRRAVVAAEMRLAQEASRKRLRVQIGPDPEREERNIRRDIEIIDRRIAQLTERRAALAAKLPSSDD